MSSDELANVFRHSVAEVVGGVASGSLMLVLLLEEGTAMSDLLESEAARRALNKLPVVKALRLRRSTADYDNFRAMLPALEANAAALVGAGGAILWQATGQEAMTEEAIVREVGAVAEAQAAKTMQMMMGQMLGQQQQQPSGAPAATPSASACRDIDSCEALKSVLDENSGASGKPVVVDFWSPACGPCMRIAPHFSSLAAEHAAKAVFLKVNAQTSSDVAKQHGVSALPTFLVFKNGAVVDQIVGADDAKLSQTVARHTSEAASIDWGDAAAPSADAPAPKEAEETPAAAPATADRATTSSADKEAQKEARRKAMNDKVAREQRERARLEQIEAEQEKAKKTQRLSRAKKAESAPAPPAEEKRRRVEPEAPAPAPAAPARAAPKAAAAAAAAPRAKDTARLSIKLLSGENHRESFPANATLDDVRQQLLAKEQGKYIFTTTYPRKTFTTVEEAMTLTDCGFVPSATLILQSLEGDLKKQAIEHPGTSTTSTSTASLLSLLNPMTWFGAAVPAAAAAAAPAPSQPSRPAPSGSSSLAARRKKDDDAQEYANGNGTAFEQ